jgi:hypothetical protein
MNEFQVKNKITVKRADFDKILRQDFKDEMDMNTKEEKNKLHICLHLFSLPPATYDRLESGAEE